MDTDTFSAFRLTRGRFGCQPVTIGFNRLLRLALTPGPKKTEVLVSVSKCYSLILSVRNCYRKGGQGKEKEAGRAGTCCSAESEPGKAVV